MIDLDLAEDLRRRYQAGEVPTMHDVALLEGYIEALHPRDHKGRWAHKAGQAEFAVAPDWAPGSGLTEAQWRSLRPDKFDADVAAIKNATDANAYLAKLGFPESDLRGDPSFPGSLHLAPDWYRQVCQCVKDATDRFPILRSSGILPFAGVRILHRSDMTFDADPELTSDAWAATGGDPRTTDMLPVNTIDRVFVAITPSEMVDQEWDVSDFAAPATSTIYGRMMHEMGHAVEMASGHQPAGPGALLIDENQAAIDFTDAEWGPRRLNERLSPYGASAAAEAWAEVFTTLNTPHGMDTLPDEDSESLLKLRDTVNARGVRIL